MNTKTLRKRISIVSLFVLLLSSCGGPNPTLDDLTFGDELSKEERNEILNECLTNTKNNSSLNNVSKNNLIGIDNVCQNILKQIEHLSEGEQNRILSKFGLLKEGPVTLSGLPLYISKGEGLSKIEVSINKEINKFLNQNEIILPQGFEEFQPAIKQICEVFPEFKFAIGSIQHMTHSKDLANHMLMVFQENMKNPL